jgi:hypothetical protein
MAAANRIKGRRFSCLFFIPPFASSPAMSTPNADAIRPAALVADEGLPLAFGTAFAELQTARRAALAPSAGPSDGQERPGLVLECLSLLVSTRLPAAYSSAANRLL